MADAVVAGASIAGLAAALALAGTGHRVRVLERSAPPPDGPIEQAASSWHRPTVPQAIHSHTLTSVGVQVLRTRAPRVLQAALAAGAELLDLTEALPPLVEDRTRQVDDDQLAALACRRSVLELVLYRAVRALPQVRIDHGITVRGLALDPSLRRVRAVLTSGGERLPAGLVVDATGRRADSRDWLAAAGVPLAEDLTHPSAITGYSRQYRLRGTTRPGPLNRGNAAGGVWDHYAAALHPGDNHTFAVAVMMPPGDRQTAGLREAEGFTAAARATPGIGAWLAPSVAEPLTPVNIIGCPPNRLSGHATTRQRPVAGLFPVGDAACVTNPLYGRGMSLALDHAFRLADLAAGAEADSDLGHAAARLAEELFTPWYEFAVQEDRQRAARWSAATGTGHPAAPRQKASGEQAGPNQVQAATLTDPLVWRSVTRVLMGLSTPAEVFGDDKFLARVRQAPPLDPALLPPAPSRHELVQAVKTTEGG
ncbi:FAD-dependent monooxygenase [Streptomyces sp. NBC_01136]|uniref:NAD(P)/FAD-dependent oxidoreductase n=1 Tax=unclassified Streptomyces TaxID=2593676 RepID=UPI00325388C7|nr:FAD-dependent monooxygenase [Streptomyces sp. NBC_01136]WST81172.1 FAD-dependent monooxygenase [Streptomyces sp. NBC_01136]